MRSPSAYKNFIKIWSAVLVILDQQTDRHGWKHNLIVGSNRDNAPLMLGVPYEVTTYTSDKRGAGTEADVYVVLYGRDTCTSQKSLCSNKNDRKKLFNKGEVAKFVVEVTICTCLCVSVRFFFVFLCFFFVFLCVFLFMYGSAWFDLNKERKNKEKKERFGCGFMSTLLAELFIHSFTLFRSFIRIYVELP